jgi:hypothetical protein
MAWRWRIALLGAIAALISVAAAVLAALPEARDELALDIAPAHFRNAKLVRLVGPSGDELYLLGTIHARHLTTPHYRLVHLAALIAHLQPDLVMVESRPQEIARGNLGDGPVEALYADLVAHERSAPVAGVDWWTMNPAHEIDSDVREEQIFIHVAAGLAGRRRTLLLIGYSHLPALQDKLAAVGYVQSPLSSARADALFDPSGQPTAFPPGMSFYTLRRIAADRAALAVAVDPFWRDRLSSAIAARQALLRMVYAAGERRGAARIAAAGRPG